MPTATSSRFWSDSSRVIRWSLAIAVCRILSTSSTMPREVRVSTTSHGERFQCTRSNAVWADDPRHTERPEGILEKRAAQIFQQLYTDGFLFDIEIFIRSRTLGIPVVEVPVQLTYEDDVTTVGQFRFLLTVIPELIHIKMLELRGVYATRDVIPAPTAEPVEHSQTQAPERSR